MKIKKREIYVFSGCYVNYANNLKKITIEPSRRVEAE